MKEVISARTSGVGPVRPFCLSFWTERPHPRWSKVWTWMPREARVGKNSL
jgi:hypothetical protein